MVSAAVEKCGVVEAVCVCVLPLDHEGFHRCACRGQWLVDEEGEFRVGAFPDLAALAASTEDVKA